MPFLEAPSGSQRSIVSGTFVSILGYVLDLCVASIFISALNYIMVMVTLYYKAGRQLISVTARPAEPWGLLFFGEDS